MPVGLGRLDRFEFVVADEITAFLTEQPGLGAKTGLGQNKRDGDQGQPAVGCSGEVLETKPDLKYRPWRRLASPGWIYTKFTKRYEGFSINYKRFGLCDIRMPDSAADHQPCRTG